VAGTENSGGTLLIGRAILSIVQIQKSSRVVDSALFVNNVKTQILRGLKTNMETNIFQVTEKADEMIQQFFQEKKDKPVVRVFLSQGG
jgi:hypothetical protein